MRIDKFLKVIRIIKRRTIAHSLIEGGFVKVNNILVKPSYKVKEGDIIELLLKDKLIKLEVLKVADRNLRKNEVFEYFNILNIEKLKEV